MNVLFEPFPDSVRVDGRDYKVVTDFREWIKLHELFMHAQKFSLFELNMILEWYEDEQPVNKTNAVRALQDFLIAKELSTEQATENEEDGSEPGEQSGKPSFSFSQDAICIYSDFRAVYGIDITNIRYMHWWQFLTLFYGLPENSQIKERMYYRNVDLKTIKGKEERDRIKRIKKLIAIKDPVKKVVDDYEIGDIFA